MTFSHFGTFSACPSAADREYAQNHESAYHPDIAGEIDTEEEILADRLKINLFQARDVIKYRDDALCKNQSLTLARIIGLLLKAENLPAMVYAISFASGLDQLNGTKNQAEAAAKIGCTKSLLSHYTIGVRDVLSGNADSFDCFKYRKSNDSRKVFKEKATDPFTAAKKAAIKRAKQPCN